MTETLSKSAKKIITKKLSDEGVVVKVADAIYQSTLKQAITEASQVPVELNKIKRVLEEATKNTDRAAAILIFALIDDLFIFYFSLFLNKEIRGGISSLFDANGMLSTAHNRITLAAGLFWINKLTYKDLNIIKKIRNKFAHETELHNFREDPIASLVNSLEPYEHALNNIEGLNEVVSKFSDRELFFVRSAILINNLVREMIVYRSALCYRVNPIDVMNTKWEGVPKNIADTSRCIADFVLEVARKFVVEVASKGE